MHFAHANAYPPACYEQFLAPFLPDYRVIGLHHRPLWPHSQPAELTSWQVIADDMARFFDEQELTGVIGVGHSLGAVATLLLAQQRPSLFSQLILIEPVFLPPNVLQMATDHPDKAAEMPFVVAAGRRRNRWDSRQEAFDRFRDKSVFQYWSDAALWDYVNNGIHETDMGNFALTYRREWEAKVYSMPPTMVWDVLPQISQPTLGIRGEHSDTIFPEAWQLWQAKQHSATFVEMEDCGHMIPMERPLALAQTIRNYLNR